MVRMSYRGNCSHFLNKSNQWSIPAVFEDDVKFMKIEQVAEADPLIFNRGSALYKNKSGSIWVPTHSQRPCLCKKLRGHTHILAKRGGACRGPLKICASIGLLARATSKFNMKQQCFEKVHSF